MTLPLDPDTLPSPARLEPTAELPSAFERFAGGSVESEADWRKRRAELRQLFRHYMYGYAPPEPDIEIQRIVEDTGIGESMRLRECRISFPALPPAAPAIILTIFLPEDATEVPVILGINREGNHAVFPDTAISISPQATEQESPRGSREDVWCVEELIERGYAFATFHCADLDPDRDDFTDGIHPYYDPSDLPGPAGTEWGTIGAWAWGAHRCVDALVDEHDIDEDRIGIIGHSRRGKTALWAAAQDERIRLAIPHQSGTGGCALSRENGQESIARITSTFPHWFADAFHGFAGRPERLPFDQHLLLALVAPRPVLDTEGSRDYWANPGLALEAVQSAHPVYEFLGVEGSVNDGLLTEGDPITDATAGRLLQYRCETEHILNERYWTAILDFADLHLK